MKTKVSSLFAVVVFALTVPFAANADSTSSDTYTFDNNGFTDYGSYTAGAATISSALIDGAYVSTSVLNVAATGNNVYNLYFTVAKDSTLSGAANWPVDASNNALGVNGVLVALSGGTFSGGLTGNNQYVYTGLKAGVTYDWITTGNVTVAGNNSFGSTFNVAAVPEPEEWAMLLAGLGLIGFKLARTRRESSAFSIGTFA
jgi:hypothetical protein